MNCLITGGAGFIGSHLADRLLSEGHTVVALDNFITGSPKNIAHLRDNSNFTFIEHDCSQPLPENTRADIVFHLASPASPPKYQAYPIETLLVNTIGTYHVLEHARQNRCRVVFASTSEVYGDPLEHPQKESYWGNVNPNGPRSCYDESKRAGEAFMASYRRKYKIDTRMVRIFNTYGPRMDLNDGRVVTNFIQQVLSGEELTIYGDGKQTRSFCYVSDLVEGIYRLSTVEHLDGEIINIGNPNEITMLEMAETVQKIAEIQGALSFTSLPEDDPKRRCPDISKAKTLLHWEPTVSLEDGLRETIEFFRKSS